MEEEAQRFLDSVEEALTFSNLEAKAYIATEIESKLRQKESFIDFDLMDGCFENDGNRIFPSVLTCMTTTGYAPIVPKYKTYLGGIKKKIENAKTNITVDIETEFDKAIFAYWWFGELHGGTLDFRIEIPIFGINKPWMCRFESGIDESILWDFSMRGELTFTLEILEDIGQVAHVELPKMCNIRKLK